MSWNRDLMKPNRAGTFVTAIFESVQFLSLFYLTWQPHSKISMQSAADLALRCPNLFESVQLRRPLVLFRGRNARIWIDDLTK